MKTRISTILAAAALMIVLASTPAYAIFGAITGALQRAQMIINQGIQIYEQQVAKLTMDGQLTELTSQFDHLKEQAMGSVGKITQPFTDLSSAPAKLIGNGISWKNEFTGVAGEFVSSIEQLGETGTSFTDSWRSRIQGSNTVSETDVLNLYADHHPEVAARASEGYLAAREAGDKRLVLNHAASDAAGNLMAAAREAAGAYSGLSSNSNVSNTAHGPGPGFRNDHPGQPDGGHGATHGVPSGEGSGKSLRTGDRPEGGPGSAGAGRAGSADPPG